MLKLVPNETNIDFLAKKNLMFVISIILVAISIFSGFKNGLNFGIDFTGGTLVEIRTQEKMDITDLRARLDGLDIGNPTIQQFGSDNEILIRIPEQSNGEDAQKIAMASVRAELGDKVEYRRVEFVGPQVGKELISAGAKAFFFSLAGILIYIWLRFEWQFGIAAVLALAHDTFLTIGLFSITQMEFNLSTVAAVLMIAGYSINDTVVVFDRVRENMRKFVKRPLSEVFNLSLNQTLSRTIMTSVTTMLALVALWVFGGEVIRGFINALIFGIIIGTYSSIFIATPLLSFMKLQRREVKLAEEEAEAV